MQKSIELIRIKLTLEKCRQNARIASFSISPLFILLLNASIFLQNPAN